MKYKKNINFKTIINAITRKYWIAIITISLFLIPSIVISFVVPTNYTSNGSFSSAGYFTQEQHQTIASFFNDDKTANDVYQGLTADPSFNEILAKNSITPRNINKKIDVAPFSMNTKTIYITYGSKNKKIVEPILNAFIDAVFSRTQEIREQFPTLSILNYASAAKNDGKKEVAIILLLCSSLPISFMVAFIAEIVDDRVFDSDDIEMLGGNPFFINASL